MAKVTRALAAVVLLYALYLYTLPAAPRQAAPVAALSRETRILTLPALLANEGSVAMLPQPFVTTAQLKQPEVKVVLDMNEEWAKLQEGSETPSALITGVLVGRTEFIDQNQQAVSDFLDAYAQSVAFANENAEETAALIGQYDIIPEAVAKAALPYCSITYIDGEDMQNRLSGYLQVLFDQNPASVGGALPDDAFYYKR